jgi:hypothetical protein
MERQNKIYRNLPVTNQYFSPSHFIITVNVTITVILVWQSYWAKYLRALHTDRHGHVDDICFVFGRSQIQISTRIPTMLTQVFLWFS